MKNISEEIKEAIINIRFCEKIVKKNKDVDAIYTETLWVQAA